MGVKSTKDVGRESALYFIELFLKHASDEAVARVLEVRNDDAGERFPDNVEHLGLHNFRLTRDN